MRRRRNNHQNANVNDARNTIFILLEETEQWNKYGDPEILKNSNSKKNEPYSFKRLLNELLDWIKLDAQRWTWVFLPFFCFTMYTMRQEVYSWPVIGNIERIDQNYMDKLIPSNAIVEIRAEKNIFSADGGLWMTKKGYEDDVTSGYFLFSEKQENIVLRMDSLAHTIYFRASGCREPTDAKCTSRKEPGSNGLAIDPFNKRLLLCEHGERRISRMEKFGSKTVIASHYNGKRFNSPNDIVISPNFDIVFTDPIDGLQFNNNNNNNDEKNEIGFQGIYRVPKKVFKNLKATNDSIARSTEGKHMKNNEETVLLLSNNISMPHGIAFSTDYKRLYVSNHDEEDAKWYQFDVVWDVDDDDGDDESITSKKRKKKKKKKKKRKGGVSEYEYTQAEVEVSNGFTLSNMKVFYDAEKIRELCLTQFSEQKNCNGQPDGMAIDKQGNLFLTGPGGVHIFKPDGTRVGSIWTGIEMTNVAFGYELLFLISKNKILRTMSYSSPIVAT